jgi:hypothetical protein
MTDQSDLGWVTIPTDEFEQLHAKNERLRAALQQISGYPHVTAQIAIATLGACQT